MRTPLLAAVAAAALACGPGGPPPPPAAGGGDGGSPAGQPGGGAAPAWPAPASEDFERTALPAAPFEPDPVPDDGAFADAGAYFPGVTPPDAYRLSRAFGEGGWLTVEAYTRRRGAALDEFAAVVPDPAGGEGRVLRIASREHTDATVVRPTRPLPPRYRMSLRVGFARFGSGVAPNGYQGGETAEPWSTADATRQNGFYWLAVLDALPRPHNNTWIHHRRKVVVDSDNHFPAWMEVWDGQRFVWSGERPVMMFALDGASPGDERTGNPFLSWSADAWQPSGRIRAVDAYLPDTWYRVTIERDGPRYAIELSGRFRYGGERTYRAEIDGAAACLWHYPATPEEAAGAAGCVDRGSFPAAGPDEPHWPEGGVWPDWFMFGDPHSNYYEGEVFYDDLRLELPGG